MGRGGDRVEGASQLMSTLDPDMAARLLRPMRDMGIDVRLEHRGDRLRARAGSLRRGRRGASPADLVILGLGRHAEQRAGREPPAPTTGARGALVVDRRQRTTLEGVYAAGDCCESRHLVSGRPTHVALGTVANKQGRVAGINLGGGLRHLPGRRRHGDHEGVHPRGRPDGPHRARGGRGGVRGRGGVDRLDDDRRLPARRQADDGEAGGRAGQRAPARARRSSGRTGAAKRIDTLATALHARMRVDELIDLDLAYAPPFATTWDPIHIAARRLAEAL